MFPIAAIASRRRGSQGINIPTPRVNIIAVLILLISFAVGIGPMMATSIPLPLIGFVLLGAIVAQSPKVAKQWERAVVLFWMVHDSQKAALEVQDYSQAVSWAHCNYN